MRNKVVVEDAPSVDDTTSLKFGLIVDDGNLSSLPSYVNIVVNPLQKSDVVPPESNSSQSQQSRSNNLTPIVLLMMFLAAALIIRHTCRKHRERRYFPESVKRHKLRDQNYKCAICKSAGV
jgi:hypothetical protein